jgi:hypothetical protein
MDSSPPPRPERPALPAAPSTLWTRLTRTPRGAAGVGIVAAALLLWPFAGLSWIPWLAGLVTLVLLAVLRLDRLLSGWVWHVGGLVVVAGLMVSSTPWAWALAASIGVLVAGLVRLPAWRVAAVGAVLCVASGAGLLVATSQSRQEAAAAQDARNETDQGLYGAPRPQGVLPLVLGRIATGSPGAVCDNLLADTAHAAFAASVGAPDCPAAVAALAARVTDPRDYADADAPSRERGEEVVVDACSMTWSGSTSAGPQLGVLTIGRAPTGPSYVVTGFAPC